MNKKNKTKTGTYLCSGIEFNELPPPEKLYKVMEKQWAEELINNGSLRFGNLEKYRCWENKTLGDEHDGKGMYTMGNHEYDTGSLNEVFAWCTSFPNISDKRTLKIANDEKYDCRVEITSPVEFFKRIATAISLLNATHKLHIQCGQITYDRGQQVNKAQLNSQKFHFNVFQKDKRFSEDCEYRISLINLSFNKKSCYISINIGNCSDIIKMKNLPA